MQTPIELIEAELGQPLSPELAEAVTEDDSLDEKLERLSGAARGFVTSKPRLPRREPGMLRPYVPSRNVRDRAHYYKLAVGEYLFDPQWADIEGAVDALKHFLLYCDGLAIDDPLAPITGAFDESPRRWWSDRSRARARLANYIRFLVTIEELVEEGIVVFVEPDEEIQSRVFALLGEDERTLVARAAEFDDFPEWSSGYVQTQSRREGVIGMASQVLAMGLKACIFHNGAVNLHLPFKHSETLLAHVVGRARVEAGVMLPEAQRQAVRESAAELQVLRHVLELRVPTFERMKPEAIINVRREDGFERLRAGIRRAVTMAGALNPAAPGYDRALRQLVYDELSQPQRRMEDEIASSRFLSRLEKGGRNLVLVGVPAIAAATVGGPLAAGGAAVLSEAARLGINWLSGAGKRAADQAYAEHALLFRPEPM
jgi:hypothetical protein